ncbi:MAG TPA: hypothetical protein VNE00_00035, partial [Paraburkholderia sp.]|nr:hypothetical protein [Paraburkholderia sp.]
MNADGMRRDAPYRTMAMRYAAPPLPDQRSNNVSPTRSNACHTSSKPSSTNPQPIRTTALKPEKMPLFISCFRRTRGLRDLSRKELSMRPRSQALQAPQAQRSSQAQQQPQLQQQPQPQQPQQSPQAQQSAQAQQSSQALRSPPSRQAPPSPQVPQTARRAAPDPNATHDRLQCHPTRQPTGIGWRYRTVALLV